MDKALLNRLQPLRERIDELDKQLLALMNERAGIAQKVGDIKKEFDVKGPVLKPEREAMIFRRLQEMNPGPFTDAAIEAVWTEIISTCRGLEEVISVAYLGPRGSFSEQAAFEHYGHFIHPVPCDSFDDVFRVVEAGQADIGVVPVENSTEGAVNRTLDLLLNTSLKVLGERSLKIHHEVMTQSGSMQGIKRILAHPQALAQCRDWLLHHYPDIPQDVVSSNALAAEIASQDSSVAAIASHVAAEAWGLKVASSGVQDDPHNRTRFLMVGNMPILASGEDKTSLILAVPNRAGAVYEMLAPLTRYDVSMSRLESRPARTGQWEYYFYVDILGHANDSKVAQALAELKDQVAFFKLLGSYPRQ